MRAEVFADVLSHWSFVAMPAVRQLASLAEVELVFAPSNFGNPLGFSAEEEMWAYRRGERTYRRKLNPAWYEGPATNTYYANAATLAAAEISGDPIGIAEKMMSAAMEGGRLLGRAQVACETAASLCGATVEQIEARATSDAIRSKLDDGNRRLAKLLANERPTFCIVNDWGDFAILKGIWRAEPVQAVAHSLLEDDRIYRESGTFSPAAAS
ncbi:MAG: DsbA family protein [Candidatus Eremiobacteraeota bacterium]|nr:DsbA family protein [Candidatus Eremiobacteraeota bacterium]